MGTLFAGYARSSGHVVRILDRNDWAEVDTICDEVIRLQEQVKFLTQSIQDLASALRPNQRRRSISE